MSGRRKYRRAVVAQVATRRYRRVSPDYTKMFVYRTPIFEVGDSDDVGFGDWFWECPQCYRAGRVEFLGHSMSRENVVWDLTEHAKLFHRQESQ